MKKKLIATLSFAVAIVLLFCACGGVSSEKVEKVGDLYEQVGSTYQTLYTLLSDNGVLEEQPDIAQQLSDYGVSISNYSDIVKNELSSMNEGKIDTLISELEALNDQITEIYNTFDASING